MADGSRTDARKHESTDSLSTSGGSLEDQIAELRPAMDTKVLGEGTTPAKGEDVAEALAQLIGFAQAIERIISLANGGDGQRLPGHGVSVRAYVDQILAGEVPESSRARLTGYFIQAIDLLARTSKGVDRALIQFSEGLAREFKPADIEAQTRAGGLLKLLGREEVAGGKPPCKTPRQSAAIGQRHEKVRA